MTRVTVETIRAAEIDALRQWFPAGARVLEIGGARGDQARAIASWGAAVESIDVAGRDVGGLLVFPVRDYDGFHIPFADHVYYVIFSSNVLEHVPHIHDLLMEMRRVLRLGGVAIHVMPSPTW